MRTYTKAQGTLPHALWWTKWKGNLKMRGYMYACQRRQSHPTPVLLPAKTHGRRSLVGCSPLGHYEPDMTEQLHFHFSLSCIG